MKTGAELQRGAARRSVRLAGIALTEGAAEGTLSSWKGFDLKKKKKGRKLRKDLKKLQSTSQETAR